MLIRCESAAPSKRSHFEGRFAVNATLPAVPKSRLAADGKTTLQRKIFAGEPMPRRRRLSKLSGGGTTVGGVGHRLKAMQEIGGALRVGCGGEYRALVILHDLKPAGDIERVILPELRDKLKVGAKKGGADLGNQR